MTSEQGRNEKRGGSWPLGLWLDAMHVYQEMRVNKENPTSEKGLLTRNIRTRSPCLCVYREIPVQSEPGSLDPYYTGPAGLIPHWSTQ
jgi:hypothetical protein